ncbi:vWA domain-containing protein [Butyrivibrio sp. YAB3001]|uniref:vWA domain-containing protein n=1 Tax=Butyrivibrio sp. YAB3001 TaxID=1520812 RepID=UPI0008F6533D|nr:VWA domain-containing protein [Butyrivibrio sp. YAB3001]SFC86921.1 Ca-activated chloride channel family protein [Butyrivibrio sp. YAB3001]
MKKNYRLMALLTGTTILAGAVTGCGSIGRNDATSASPGSSGNGMKSAGYADEAEAPAEMWATEESCMTATESAVECYGTDTYYDCFPYEKNYNTESYDKPDENGFYLSVGQPLSTFAADVDTASYANVRRMIETGYSAQDIVPEAVRPEEFINYFSYELNSPKKGEKFGVTTEISACPWNSDHQLMFVGVKAKNPYEGTIPKSNLVFLIDVSGSMDEKNKLYLLQDCFKNLVDNLPGEGVVSIVTYASKEEVVLDGEDMKNKNAIKKAINSLSAGGCTAGERGMEMAYEIAKENFIEGGNNRIIMATDGDLNVGISDPDELERFIEKKKESGIYLSVLGFGDGNYKDDRLERLADCGNGNYSYIDSKLEGHKVLVEEMTSTLVTVAKDVKFQVEFNPAKVNAYRLIGYENRQMDAVDFNDDKKDGGELGAGHSVVALYEIIPAGAKSAIDLKYQQVANTDASDEFATIKIRYKEPDADNSELISYVVDNESFSELPSDNLAFAELAAEFAMLLSDSDYAGSITYKDIRNGYKNIKNRDEYKEEFLNLVRMVEKRS